jgi:hypothetical protein
MGRTYDEIIAEQAGKSITMTAEQLQDFHRDAFFDGHRCSKYDPNISGSCKMYFVNSDAFEKLKEAPNNE